MRSKVGSGLNVEAEASRLATPTDEDVFAERRSKLASYRDLLSEGDAHGYDKRRREDLDRRIREIEGKPEFRSEALDESLNQVVRTAKLHGASAVDVEVFRQFVQESPLDYRERALAEAERFFKKEDVIDSGQIHLPDGMSSDASQQTAGERSIISLISGMNEDQLAEFERSNAHLTVTDANVSKAISNRRKSIEIQEERDKEKRIDDVASRLSSEDLSLIHI